MTNWTEAQASAISDRGGALLVSAAAGSGKTAVLVERAFCLMTDKAHPVAADRLLLVTFSNASAAELRARIARRLEEALAEEPQSRFLLRQRMLLGRARIQTVHAFCLDLIKEHFSELDISPSPVVATEAQLAPLRAQALEEVMEQAYADPSFVKLCGLYGRSRSDAAAQKAILDLYEFSRSLPFPKRELQRFISLYREEGPLKTGPFGEELLSYAAQLAKAAEKALLAAEDALLQDETLLPYAQSLSGDRAAFAHLGALIQNGSWNEAAVFAAGLGQTRLKPVRGGDERVKQQVQALRAKAAACLADLQKEVFICSEEEYLADLRDLAPQVSALCGAALRFAEVYGGLKTDSNFLEFSDFEHLALRLLYGEEGAPTALARTVAQRFDAIMVDEFQDTSSIQNALFEAVCAPGGENLFFVGDVKQSIYRFRGANPELFLKKRAQWPLLSAGRHPATILLGHNFRSAAPVIDGVNDLFSTLMRPDVGEMVYSEEELLVEGAPHKGDASFEFHLVDSSLGGEGEAGYVAKLIVDLVQSKALVEENGALRPCRYDDFCILLRSPGPVAETYLMELEKRGVPARADAAGDLLKEGALQPVLAALRVVDNPAQDIPLAAALLSPLFAFSADEVTALRAAHPEGPLYAAVLLGDTPKTRAFLAQLRHYRTLSAVLPVHRLLEELLTGTDYELLCSLQPGAENASEQLRGLLEWAEEYDGAGYGGLSGFLRTVDGALAGKGVQMPSLAAGHAGQVSILSVHRSKGLEFPFCILAGTGRLFNKRDLYSPVLYHPALGIGLSGKTQADTLYPTLPQRAIRHRQEREMLSEEMRILYVALTRAKQKMIITMSSTAPESLVAKAAGALSGGEIDTPYLTGCTSVGGWLLAAFLTHPAGEELRALAGAATLALRPAKNVLRCTVQPAPAAGPPKEAPPRPAPDDSLVQELVSSFGKKALRAPLSEVPVKMSVSQLAKGEESKSLERPSFMYAEGLSAAEAGSALHSFMQFADYTAAGQNFAAEVERLVEGAFLLPETAAALPEAQIKAFLSSPLAQRIAAAKQVLREYPFITALPAGEVASLPKALQNEPVMVQGIADCVLVEEGGAILVDYKTDRVKTEGELARRYKQQLLLYRRALEPRLGLPVTRCLLYSFHLGREVEIF